MPKQSAVLRQMSAVECDELKGVSSCRRYLQGPGSVRSVKTVCELLIRGPNPQWMFFIKQTTLVLYTLACIIGGSECDQRALVCSPGCARNFILLHGPVSEVVACFYQRSKKKEELPPD